MALLTIKIREGAKYECNARSTALAWSVFIFEKRNRASWKTKLIRVVRER